MCVHDGNALINSGCDSNMTPSSELALIVSPIKIDSSFSVKKNDSRSISDCWTGFLNFDIIDILI